MNTEIDLVDFGGGNIGSISRCLERLGIKYRKADGSNPPTGDRPVVVPGVGAFGAVMDALKANGLDKCLIDLAKNGTPYLGICVGMQVLFESSEESPRTAGLGIIPGKVVRFQHEKVPQIGWNKLTARQNNWTDGYAYFVNSYYAQPSDQAITLYEAEYDGPFCAAIAANNVTAFQFHPEKSGSYGEALIERWLANVS